MKSERLLDAQAVRQRLQRLFQRKRCEWIAGEGQWPLMISLGLPDQKTALNNRTAVGEWIDHWRQWRGDGELRWCWRDWPVLGRQQLPEKIIFAHAGQVTSWLDTSVHWDHALRRVRSLVERWPQLQHLAANYHELLAEYSPEDFESLQNVLTWFIQNPDSQLYARQLPIPGIDTKWLQSRQGLIIDFLAAIKNVNTGDFHAVTGLKPEPNLIRLRILDPELRGFVGGLSDLAVSVTELSQLSLPVKRVYIVENLRTGLAFSDLPGAVVFMGLGYGVSQLAEIPWIKNSTDCYYWGDIDTHGLAILDRARAHLPTIKSILMNEKTLLDAKPLWVIEPKPCRLENLQFLTPDEKTLYLHLRDNFWGHQIRLEQERIHWQYAWETLIIPGV